MLTERENMKYIGGKALICNCGAVLATQGASGKFKVCESGEGDLYIKCRKCKRIVTIKS